ncbi:MAG: hypothetical protein DWP92_01065 [Armatimonadetes bacterium]|nr:MAG: hypothetical protein DWP92_01065 [Armatimonadota bacterium]
MQRRIGILAPSVFVMATALFLAGCSGFSTSTTVPEKSAGPTDTVGSFEASGEGPTLSDFVPGGVAFGDGVDAEQQYRQMEREAQDKIAACMAAEGFEYVPYVENQDQGGFATSDVQEEFAAQYGFGVVAMILGEQQIGEAEIEAEMAKDPNSAIVEAMSDTERDAYVVALYGVPPEFEFEESADGSPQATTAPVEPSGCQNIAYAETFDQEAQTEFFEQFGPMMNDLYSDLESDPRIAELDGKWSACMAKNGYDFKGESDAEMFLLRRLEEAGAVTLELSPDGDMWGFSINEFEPGGPIEAAVKEIGAEELAMTQVSSTCSDERDKVFQEVYREAEQRFIAQHLAELAQFRRDHS